MKYNDRAPYSGVLIPESHYRSYLKDHDLVPLYEKNIEDCQREETAMKLPDISAPSVESFFLGAGIGVVVTLTIMLIAGHG